jgi:SLT domain-containing protein
MTSAVVAKLREPPVDVEITRLQAKVDDLNRQLTNFERDLAIARLQADRWRALVERREEQRVSEEMLRAQTQTQQLMAMAYQQQANINAQQAQQGQALAQQNYFQGNLGSQAQALEWCNCVPARHDMFRLG